VRADAQRNVERILDAAVDALTDDIDASMTEVARRAGVARATVYVHFPTREALIDAVRERAFSEVGAVIADAAPDQGEPAEALRRVVAAAWRKLGRYHALVAITTAAQTPEELHERHAAALGPLLPLIRRGQDSGAFRGGAPALWHIGMAMALIHAASAEVRAGRIDEAAAEQAIVATVLGALSA
jgi:TetR/AcrR family transcriptional repressor of mexCD-oprJ operon